MKCLIPGTRYGSVIIPASKSVAHRLLICAALGEKPVKIILSGISDDIRATAMCLKKLGAIVQIRNDGIEVQPITQLPVKNVVLPCGESGSTLRFLLPLVGALGVSASFYMEGRLSERPMAEFESLLQSGGMKIHREGNSLHCEGHLKPGNYELLGNISSQYFSGLLFALPLLNGDSSLLISGELESQGYIHLTELCLKLADISIFNKNNGWVIPGRQKPQLPDAVETEGDWSGAAFFLGLGALSERGLLVKGLNTYSHQGDRAILNILSEFGANISITESGIFIQRRECRSLIIDASPIPDLIPVLTVLACAAEGDTIITNAARLRYKESDRLQTSAKMIRSLGGNTEEKPDGLIIHGTGSLAGGTVDSFRDHRIAMSAAVATAICRKEVRICDENCVSKSYPGFWKDFELLETVT